VDFAGKLSNQTMQRAGPRYVNHIELTADQGVRDLQRYMNLPVEVDRFDPGSIEQMLTEFRLALREERKITIRGALLSMPGKAGGLFVLDLDCYTQAPVDIESLSSLLDEFHHHIQVQFLDHIREEYKDIMRGTA
jgi:uncharacterized protein (TIGR04255 family)